jgi:Flp pilus assembly pilin Flp
MRHVPSTHPTRRHRRDETGITTAEYAVGTAAGAGLAGLLYKLLSGGFGDQMLRTLFDHVLSLLGIG